MTTDNETPSARIVVEFHSSSTKGGAEAFKVVVLEGATEAEAVRVMALARSLRAQAKEALEALPDLTAQLEKSIEGVTTTGAANPHVGAPPICGRCSEEKGRPIRHGKVWQHKGDCPRCMERPITRPKETMYCDPCTAMFLEERASRVDEALEKMK